MSSNQRRDREEGREKNGSSREFKSANLKIRHRDERADERSPAHYRDYYSSRVPPLSRPTTSGRPSTSSQNPSRPPPPNLHQRIDRNQPVAHTSTNFNYGSNVSASSESARSSARPQDPFSDKSQVRGMQGESLKKRRHVLDEKERRRLITEPESTKFDRTTGKSFSASSESVAGSSRQTVEIREDRPRPPSSMTKFRIPKKTNTGEIAKETSTSSTKDESPVATKKQGFTEGRILPSTLCATRGDHAVSKKGTTGRPITLSANYFRLQQRTDWCLNEYHVKYDPNIEKDTVLKKRLLREHKNHLQGYIFDGSVLYTTCKYPKDLEFMSRSKDDSQTYRLTVSFSKEIDKNDYTYLQFYNILVRKCFQIMDLKLIGRNFFDPKGSKSVQEPGIRIDLYPGYVTSIRQYERDVLMNAEIVHKIIRQDSLLTIFQDCYRKHSFNFKDKYEAEVIGMNIITRFNSHTYTIVEVDYEKTPRSTFPKKDGSTISFADYYRQRERPIVIQDLNQPLLRAKQKRKERRGDILEEIYLVPELCFPLGLTDEMKSNQRLMRPIANHTRVNPRQRIQHLLEFNQRLSQHNQIYQELQQWNLKLENKLVDVPGRVLDKEIIYNSPGRAIEYNNGDWTRSLRRQLYSVAHLKDWFVIYPKYGQHDVDMFIRKFIEAARSFAVPVEQQPRYHPIERDDALSYTMEIERITSKCMPKIIFCFIPNRHDIYSVVKKKCMVDRSVLSQAIQLSLVKKKDLLSIASKVVVQVNAKMGGVPWTIDIKHDGLMVVGFSNARDKSRKENYEAVVATMDKRCTQYYSTISISKDKGNDKDENQQQKTYGASLTKAMRAYENANRAKPKFIVIYRDGISDGEVPKIIEEVDSIKKTLHELYGNSEKVKFAYVLVSKKINTRLFFNGENPPGGTVVDDVITNPLKYDFYLVPQSVRSGSVSPTAYNVVHSIKEFSPNDMQSLTYKLTHTYYNWFGTVRIPAPCQYATKLIRLVSESVHSVPSAELNNTLHYL